MTCKPQQFYFLSPSPHLPRVCMWTKSMTLVALRTCTSTPGEGHTYVQLDMWKHFTFSLKHCVCVCVTVDDLLLDISCPCSSLIPPTPWLFGLSHPRAPPNPLPLPSPCPSLLPCPFPPLPQVLLQHLVHELAVDARKVLCVCSN